MPSSAPSAPISLAKAIFTAWNALQAYLISSAVRRETRHGSTWTRRIKRGHARDGRAVLAAHHNQGWLHEVPHRGAFAQKLGIRDDAGDSGRAQEGRHHLLAGSGKHSAANGHDEGAGAGRQRVVDFQANTPQLLEPKIPVTL